MAYADRDRGKAYQKAWNAANSDRVRAYHKKYRESNREKVRNRARIHAFNVWTRRGGDPAWREMDREKHRLRQARYRERRKQEQAERWERLITLARKLADEQETNLDTGSL